MPKELSRKGGDTPKTFSILPEKYAAPHLWSEDHNSRISDISAYGISNLNNDGDITDTSGLILDHPKKLWISEVIGVRVIPEVQRDGTTDITFETVALPTLGPLQKEIATTVLEGEECRPIMLVDPPYPEKATDHPMNNDAWIEAIHTGGSPVMRDIPTSDGKYTYDTHDFGLHAVNAMLLPKEYQAVTKETAGYELEWRQRLPLSERRKLSHEDKQLLLPGETHSTPDAWAYKGQKSDGVEKLDVSTDIVPYTDVLAYLVSERDRDPLDILGDLREKAAHPKYDIKDTLHDQSVRGVRWMPAVIGDLVNFNTRHSEGRNTTQEEVDEVMEKVYIGTARVANKIRRRIY